MSLINKRQQARNERILQDLLKSAPGNDRCADCGTQNPGWCYYCYLLYCLLLACCLCLCL